MLYNGEIEGFECSFPCFVPEYDAVFHALSLLPTRRHTAFGINLRAKLANNPQTRHFSCKILRIYAKSSVILYFLYIRIDVFEDFYVISQRILERGHGILLNFPERISTSDVESEQN